jgi:hypothetical protein
MSGRRSVSRACVVEFRTAWRCPDTLTARRDSATKATVVPPTLVLKGYRCAAMICWWVWKLDRLGRTTRGLINFMELLQERGIGLKNLS